MDDVSRTTTETTTAQKLADRNYPSDYEWNALIAHQEDDYDTKLVGNLRAMLFFARAELEGQRALLRELQRDLHPMAGSYWHRRFSEVGL